MGARVKSRTVCMAALAAKTASVLIVAVLLGGCTLGYGPPEDHSRFVSSKATPDGRHGVFSHKALVYSPAAGWRAFPDGGIPDYRTDTDTIGIFDFETGSTRVVVREENSYWQPGQGEFFVARVSDTKALVTRGGQRRSDYMHEYRQFMLDIPSGRLTPLPLGRELESRGRGMGYFFLVDEMGTLVFETPPLDAPSDYMRHEKNPKQIWIRRPDGGYVLAATAVYYYAYTGGRVHYLDFETGKYMVYDSVTNTRRMGVRYPPSGDPETTFDLVITPGDKGSLSVARRLGDEWVYDGPVVDAGMF